jgi:FdhE protein
MSSAKWDKRIERARELAGVHSFAAQGLRFYEHIAGFQQRMYAGFEAGNGRQPPAKRPRPPGSLREELQLDLLVPWFESFLGLVEEIAPPPLAGSAAELAARGSARWQEVLAELWREGVAVMPPEALTAPEALLSWAFLQPYAEYLADRTELPEDTGTPSVCPLCCGRPLVGVLRPQGDGGRRSLICALCATEWVYRRIVCPACGEESVGKLPIYVAEELGHVRVEACDTCHCYIKTIDLTKSGRAVPVVDELAAIPLSLWAEEHGYTKLSPNLLGV